MPYQTAEQAVLDAGTNGETSTYHGKQVCPKPQTLNFDLSREAGLLQTLNPKP